MVYGCFTKDCIATIDTDYILLAYPERGEIKELILKGNEYKPLNPKGNEFVLEISEGCKVEIPQKVEWKV